MILLIHLPQHGISKQFVGSGLSQTFALLILGSIGLINVSTLTSFYSVLIIFFNPMKYGRLDVRGCTDIAEIMVIFFKR